MLSNSSLDMLNESLTYIIYKTVRYFDNDVLYLNCMRIYSLTELIDEAVKDRRSIHPSGRPRLLPAGRRGLWHLYTFQCLKNFISSSISTLIYTGILVVTNFASKISVTCIHGAMSISSTITTEVYCMVCTRT